jgi:hypothetical protein
MNQVNPQNIPAKADETPSNNENNTKQASMILEDTRKLLEPKASARKRTQCSEERAIQMQHAKRSTKPSLKPTSDSIETVDKPKQFTKEYSLPKENHRLLLS